MIKILGAKRVLVLSLLVSVNALFAMMVYSVLMPESQKMERELGNLESNIRKLRNDIADIKVEYEQIKEQEGEFKELEAKGFFEPQNRRQVQENFTNARERSGVINAVVSFEPGVNELDEAAREANYTVLNSAVNIEIQAINDRDVYLYIDEIKKEFPGHLSITSVQIERELDVSRGVLRNIAFGDNPSLVSANVVMAWRTMIPYEGGDR